jgi:hypothetical protein
MDELAQDILLRQQILDMPTHPLRLTRLALIEIIEHCMYIDVAGSDQQLSYEQMKQCRARFIRFCADQWLNKN